MSTHHHAVSIHSEKSRSAMMFESTAAGDDVVPAGLSLSQPRTLAWWASVLESVSVDEPLPRSKKSWATVGQLVLTRDPTS